MEATEKKQKNNLEIQKLNSRIEFLEEYLRTQDKELARLNQEIEG